MKLSTYVGLRAIAWIVTDGAKVVQHGVKRVNISFDNYYEFLAGNPVTKRINRRMKAGARRNLWRFKSRRNNLKKTLQKNGFSSEKKYSDKEIYQLRVKALSEKVSSGELGAIFLSLQNKRGYKSLRGVSDAGSSEHLQKIAMHEDSLKSFKSIADYLLTLESAKDIIFMRQSYINEFNAICAAQQLDEKLQKKIFDTIYYQRPLKKPKVGNCKYEKTKRKTHESNPIFQEFRIWRDVMNIVIYDRFNDEIEIPFAYRKAWVKKLQSGANLSKAQCLKDLGIKISANLFTWYSGKAIAGNSIRKTFDDLKVNCDYFELWQDVYSATDDDKLSNLLSKKYGFDEKTIEKICDLDLSKFDWTDYSAKAISKLLPLLQSGKTLKEAILDTYGKVSFTDVSLRNVVLEQHYFSYKALLSQLSGKYNFEEVNCEIDALLKASNKGRKEMSRNKRKEEKFAKENDKISSYNLLKLKLWIESNECSPYEPDVMINKEDLFSDKYNIDHIVPKSKIFETGYPNMVICRKELNEQKGRLTGLDFAKELGIEETYRDFVEKVMPESKHKFLLMSENDIPEDWVSKRQNSDYNTRVFSGAGSPATNIPNKLLNKYLNEWKLPKYADDDCRSYLVKAWLLANFSQETVNYFDEIKEKTAQNTSLAAYSIKPNIESIDFDKPNIFMPRIKFCRKGSNGISPRFGLHKETVFGQRKRIIFDKKGLPKEEVFYKIRKPVSGLSGNMVENIMDAPIKKLIATRLTQHKSHEDGVLSLVENPVMFNGKPVKRVSVGVNSNSVIALHSTDGKGNTGKFSANERKVDFVLPENHYCLDVTCNGEKVQKSIVTLLKFVNAIKNKENVFEGKKLQANTVIELDGEFFFCLGAGERMTLRSVNVLSAKSEFEFKSDQYKKAYIVHINQLGEVTKKEKLV
jgi:hypothetical protein